MEEYQEKLKGKGIIQSMSRKATCLDNAVAENFFSLLKMELICIQDFETIENLADGIGTYIQYYNEKRIKLRLNSEMQDNAGYNDSLIVDAYADEGDAATEWSFSYHYAVRVPKLLSDSEDAKALNAELMALYGSEAMRPPESDSIKYAIGWESHWDGSLLSLEMTAVQPDGETHHDIYYFDFAAGKRLSGEDVLARIELSWEKPDYSYATVYALDSSGVKHDLANGFGCDGEDGTWYSLSFDAVDGIHAQVSNGDTVTNYTGFPLRLGMRDSGLIYALDFWDEAGGEELFICALQSGNGMLVMQHFTGGSPFGLRPGETIYLLETYG